MSPYFNHILVVYTELFKKSWNLKIGKVGRDCFSSSKKGAFL